jgi:putative inorganic carbon (hco3(-)) transporter
VSSVVGPHTGALAQGGWLDRANPPAAGGRVFSARSRDVRLGMALSLFFALGLTAARVIDVSEDGKAVMLFGLTFFPALAAAAIFRPLWFLLLTVAYLPFSKVYPLSLGGITGANLSNLILLLAPVAWAASRAASRVRLRPGALEGLLLLYVLVASFSVLPSLGHSGLGELLQTYRGWLVPFLYFFIARGLVRDRRGMMAVLQVLAVVAILVAALTWVEGLSRSGRGSIEVSRVPGLMLQANQMGAFLVYYGTVLLALGLRARGLGRRLLFLAGFLIAARAMLFTFSRAAYLSLGAGSATVVLLHNPLLLAAGAGAGAAAVAVNPALIPDSIRARLAETNEGVGLEGEQTTLDKSSAYRLILWKAAFRMIRERPLTGIGLGRFSSVVGGYTEVELSKEDPNDAHNAFILIAAEMGLPALALVLVLLLSFLLTALRLYLKRRDPVDRSLALAFVGCCGGLVVSNMLGSRFQDESLISYFWILAGLLAVARLLPVRRPRRRRA